jgi:phosphoglycerate kinase
MEKMTIKDIDVKGKRVLVRVDFNVPLDKNTNAITDDNRIRATIPTIDYLIQHGAMVILCSHLGNPDGKVEEKLRLAPIGARLSQIINKPVTVTRNCIGPETESAVAQMNPGDIILLENTRFHLEEKKNDPAFAQALARLADIYVNDAFGTAHRAHASTAGVAQYLPAVAGLLMEKELTNLGKILSHPEHPFVSLSGGAKLSDKMAMLQNILDRVDIIMIGGGMAATFLKANGHEVGKSLMENDKLDFCRDIMKVAAMKQVRFLLPRDVLVAERPEADAPTMVVNIDQIPPNWGLVDIGPETIKLFSEELKKCKTVFWNGPMGIYEIAEFSQGTRAMARLLAGLKATTVIGGGSTAEAVADMKLADKMTFVSTGGGASLMFLGGKSLPGFQILNDKITAAGNR